MKQYFLVLIIALVIGLPKVNGQQLSESQTESQISLEIEQTEKPLKRAWLKPYIQKMTRVSPRVAYGIGSFETSMSYDLPDIGSSISNAANDLKTKNTWVPWKNVSIEQGATSVEKTLRKNGNFFITTGINLPIVFIDVEAGIGRFSEPLLTVADVWPPQAFFQKENLGKVMVKRVTTPESKAAVTARIGMELERVLPDHLVPRITFGQFTFGVDASAYYLIGADLSYKVGSEVIDPNAVDKLAGSFSGVPLVSNKIKREAAEAIVGHVESSLPTYFWTPAMKGWGFSTKLYVDIGKSLRIAGRYHSEKSKGMNFQDAEWLQEGPTVLRNFFTIGIESKL